MSLKTARRYIENRLKEQLGFHYPKFQLEYNNTKNDKVKGRSGRVVYTIMTGKGFRTNLGNQKIDRFIGELQLDVLVPSDVGNGLRDEVCDFLGDVFNEVETTLTDNARLRFKVPAFTEAGVKSEESRAIVSIPFWRDEAMKNRA